MPTITPAERQREDVARTVLDTCLPDPLSRTFCLTILADTILHAHALHPRRWGVTLLPQGGGGAGDIRLTVGMVYVCNIYPDGITLTLDGLSQNATVLQPYLHADDIKSLQNVANGIPICARNNPYFPSLPEAVWCWFQAHDIAQVWPLVHQSYTALVTKAAGTRLNPSIHRAHSPGVLKVLRTDLHRHIPDPGYITPSSH